MIAGYGFGRHQGIHVVPSPGCKKLSECPCTAPVTPTHNVLHSNNQYSLYKPNMSKRCRRTSWIISWAYRLRIWASALTLQKYWCSLCQPWKQMNARNIRVVCELLKPCLTFGDLRCRLHLCWRPLRPFLEFVGDPPILLCDLLPTMRIKLTSLSWSSVRRW